MTCSPGTLRSHHAILYAGLGGASSARSDEQPGLGVHPERVQRERGPVELHTPAPAHPARAFTAGPAEPATCRAPPSTAAEPGAAAGGKADGPRSVRRSGHHSNHRRSLRSALAQLSGLGLADAQCAGAALLGPLSAQARDANPRQH